MKIISWLGYMFMAILAVIIGNLFWCVLSVWWAERLDPATTPPPKEG